MSLCMSVVKREQIVALCLCMLLLYNWSTTKSFDYGMDSSNLKDEYNDDNQRATKTEDRLVVGRRCPFWSLHWKSMTTECNVHF